jgi:hypothetical protein
MCFLRFTEQRGTIRPNIFNEVDLRSDRIRNGILLGFFLDSEDGDTSVAFQGPTLCYIPEDETVIVYILFRRIAC